MKKISKGYYIAAALLVILAAGDFYRYSLYLNGKSSIIYFVEVSMFQQLVDKHLIPAIAELLLAGLVILAGWWNTKRKKTIRSKTAVALLLIVAVMGVWIVSMDSLRAVVAQGLSDTLYEKGLDYAASVGQYGSLPEFYETSGGRSDYLEHQMFLAIGEHSSASYHGEQYNDRNGIINIRDISYPVETAVLFYDGDGKLLHSSEEDVMYFRYYTQEQWEAGIDSSSQPSYGWIDISAGKNAENWQEDLYLRFRNQYAGTGSLERMAAALRVTGYFEGTQLKPVTMHYVTHEGVLHGIGRNEGPVPAEIVNAQTMASLDRTGGLGWQLQFDRSGEYEGKELVTVYIDHPAMWDYAGKPLTYQWKDYESLADLAESLELPLKGGTACRDSSIYEVDELVVFSIEAYRNPGEDTADLYLVTAIRCDPYAFAAAMLLGVSIVTGLSVLGLFLLAYFSIKKRLIQPVADVAAAMEDGWRRLEQPEKGWREVKLLQAGFADERDRRQKKDDEIIRLNTALRFAKTAEENRRRMVSNIAHELKTPLAVIHSYAEGLKEHIAEDKRDKYADVILAEAERADAMVLEMLDLSRLEAGKVKLSRDEFSLGELTRSVFERLHMAVQGKNLQVDYVLPENSTVIADENRIGQVVENFATNAVKYTPAGGHITVKIRSGRNQTTFSIENDSEPLSSEALERVWDTFYRTDESRSTGGTGLGLAIAKSIVELHGGKCSVRNTKTGVEFSFTV